jgi:hypothetical protein
LTDFYAIGEDDATVTVSAAAPGEAARIARRTFNHDRAQDQQLSAETIRLRAIDPRRMSMRGPVYVYVQEPQG